MVPSQLKYIAVTNYSCGAYGAGGYNTGQTGQACASAPVTPTPTPGTSTGDSSSTSGGGTLANTGYDVIIPVALGLALVGAAVVLIVKKVWRKRHQSTDQ